MPSKEIFRIYFILCEDKVSKIPFKSTFLFCEEKSNMICFSFCKTFEVKTLLSKTFSYNYRYRYGLEIYRKIEFISKVKFTLMSFSKYCKIYI